ncbi:MAG: LPS export ABC transporter permease LptG [Gammaproteobacteria bacterium RIFCSPHIGHO2_12_FULL_35_23]|nr:MAG: LPS export ABC transporter permease LptG [Gammaproteobacteria bacterium RIFCSPHIGHO2_12_FULL_35_23]
MKIIPRYIGTTVIRLTLLVLLVVLGMEFFISIIGEFTDIGHGTYGLLQALQYVALSLPNNLYSLFPMIGLIGSLMGLGSLATTSELVVMRTAGVSVFSIIWAVLKAALLLVIVVTFIGEFIAPSAQQIADKEKVVAESNGQAAKTAQGVWFKNGNTFIRVTTVLPNMQMQGITAYQFDQDRRLQSVFSADQGQYAKGQWTLQNVQQTTFTGQQLVSQTIPSEVWNIELNSRILGVTSDNTSEMNLLDLFHYINDKKRSGLTATGYSLAFWQRLFQPIATVVMIFLAIPFIFGPLRSVTMGVRIVTGAVLGFAFYLLNQFFGPFSLVYQIPPIIGAGLPIILFAGFAIFLMRRVK